MKRMICLLMAAMLCFAGFAALADEIEIQPAVIETPSAGTEAPDEAAVQPTEAQEEPPEPTEEAVVEAVSLAFEDGFALDLPADWKHYPLTQEMADMGVIYCLSDAAGARWMYIQKWNTDCADMDALLEVVSAASDPGNSGIREVNGTEFIIYNIAAENVSCCAAMLGDQVLNFVFTPQTDMDFMAQAVQIIGTFREV
ncbi:MAG: hypothetical protein IJA26_07155 [Clostridia bacterium]|nr:hypothetical protein [Clostridia bacterium]